MLVDKEPCLATKIIAQENWGSRGGDDGKFVGLGVVCETEGCMGNAGWENVGCFGHDEVGAGGGEEGEAGLFGHMEGEGGNFGTRVNDGCERSTI